MRANAFARLTAVLVRGLRRCRERHSVVAFSILLAIAAPGQCAGDDILFAQVLPLGGGNPQVAREVAAGRAACVDLVNAQGGVGGRHLALQTLDDKGRKSLTGDLLRQSVDDPRVVALLGPIGPAAGELALRIAGAQGLLVVDPIGGSVGNRVQQATEGSPVVFLTANQSLEGEKLATHLASLGLKVVVVITSSDAEGLAARTVFEEALQVASLPANAIVPVEADGSDARSAVSAASSHGAAAVLLATSNRATVAVLQALASRSGTGAPVLQAYGMSSSLPPEELARLGKAAYGLTMTQVMPSWQDVRLPLAASFREAMSEAHRQPTYAAFEGCLSVLTTVELARRTKGTVTRSSLAKAARSATLISVGGYDIDPLGRGHVAERQVEIVFVGADGRLVR